MIILDLEWNTGYGAVVRLDEILQIGAVKVGHLGGPILDTFCAYIRPRIHKRYSPAAEVLPARKEYEASDLDFPTAYHDFVQWCGQETEFASWGGDDLAVLRQSLDYWKVTDPLPDAIYDLQAAFLRTLGADRGVSLQWAAEYCGLPTIFDFHNALFDALYTALVGGYLDQTFLPQSKRTLAPPQEKGERKKTKPMRFGPFDTKENLLNHRGCRLAVCPVCGLRQRISHWSHGEKGPYYGKFSCAHHGSYLLRLDLHQDSSQRYWAVTRVLDLTPENKRCLNSAKKGEPFRCESRPTAQTTKRRRYYSSRPKRGKK
jgi:inhibitor of KinA sporulation pathway (predicted exonuclease)